MKDDEIVIKYDPHIRKLAFRFRDHFDDLVQIGRIELLAAARCWRLKTEHTAQFWTYAYKRVLGAMMDYATAEAIATLFDQWEEDRHDPGYQCWPSPDTVLEAKEYVASLTDEEAAILSAHLSGKHLRAIAAERGESKSVVHEVLTGALENIRASA